jgi:hypothetical protein
VGEKAGTARCAIVTVHGVGYKLGTSEDDQ